MSDASRKVKTSQQVNFTLDAHWRLVLRLAAEADDVSVPDLIRPVIMRYLRNRLRDEDLREAVARIEQVRRSRQGVPDNVKSLPRGDHSRRSRKAGDSRSQEAAASSDTTERPLPSLPTRRGVERLLVETQLAGMVPWSGWWNGRL
jgi:Mg-chelatase subunit ChlI